ncbi:MAG: hypothetical protein ACK5Q5_16215 [Planctomycetaceae bacterium]
MQAFSRVHWIGWSCCGAALVTIALMSRDGSADDVAKPAPKSTPASPADADAQLRTFMRRKLEASSQILEGLTTDDFQLVKDGARRLQEMSTAEKFRVSKDPIYRQFNADFNEITRQLIQAADDGNADRAAMKWMDATINCMDCHRFVRGMHIARD